MSEEDKNPLPLLVSPRRMWLLVATLVLVVFVGLTYLSYFKKDTAESVYHGTILLTLNSQEDARHGDDNFVSDIFTLDPSSGELDKLIAENSFSATMASFSPDKKYIVVAATPLNEKGDMVDQPQQIYTYNRASEELIPITGSNKFFKRTPTFSPDGSRIAFVTIPDNRSILDQILPVENFAVHVTDLNGNEKFITRGTQPHWVSDDKLLVLKNNGIHEFTVDGEDRGVVWWSEGNTGVLSNTTIDLSDDKSMIAWAAPEAGYVAILEIDSWESYKVGAQTTFPGNIFWPQFSPGNKFIAGYELTPSGEGRQLVVYDLRTGEKNILFDLKSYLPESVAITEWAE